MHYYQFEIKEWQSNTSHLTLEEEAIYLRLINWYYDSEKPIPKDTATLFRKLRITEQCGIAQMILLEFFLPLETGEWIHKRCDKAINAFKNKSDKARDSANLRWHGKQNAKAMQTHTEPNANHKSLIINQESNIQPAPKVAVIRPDDVQESIWNDYLAIRKAQKKPITATALKGLQREALKASITLNDALTICCERNWIGFKADWVKNAPQIRKDLPLGTDKQIEEAYRIECGGDPSKARFNSYFEMRNFILKTREERTKV